MHLGNVRRILEKRVKHSATPRILHASLVFSKHFPRALSHHKRTRLVFYFLTNTRPSSPNDKIIFARIDNDSKKIEGLHPPVPPSRTPILLNTPRILQSISHYFGQIIPELVAKFQRFPM